MGSDETERQHDFRKIQQSNAVSLQAIRPRLRPHCAAGIPIRPQGTGLQERQPKLRQS